MRKINKPKINAKTVFNDCISIVKNKTLKENLSLCLDIIEDAEEEFIKKFGTNKIHLIPQSSIIKKPIGKKEMEKVYSNRMVKKGVPGRNHYDYLLSLATGGKCPLCSQRIVSTLDHYLPKSKYPIYSVTPINLIPSCSDCNKGKLSDYPKSSNEETLHPYFDDIENDIWLSTKILQTTPISFCYYVAAPTKWTNTLKKRVEFHFESFNINYLYSIHAAEELQNIKNQLTNLYKLGGKKELMTHLNDCLESREKTNKNSWQSAFYRSLHKDTWFLNTGIKTL